MEGRRLYASALLLAALVALSGMPNCQAAARGLKQATTPTLGANLQKQLGNLQAYSVQNLLSSSVAKATADTSSKPASSGSSLVNTISSNFQSLVNDQAEYFQNLQGRLAAGNGTNAQRLICDFYNVYQVNMANLGATGGVQLISSNSALGQMLANRTIAEQLRTECKSVSTANSTLSEAVAALLADTPTAQLVQTLNGIGSSSSGSGTKPMQQSSALGSIGSGPVASYLNAAMNQGAAGGSGSGTNLMGQLYNTMVQLVGRGAGTAAAETGSGALGSGNLVKSLQSAAAGTGAGAGTLGSGALVKSLQGAAAGTGAGAGALGSGALLNSLQGAAAGTGAGAGALGSGNLVKSLQSAAAGTGAGAGALGSGSLVKSLQGAAAGAGSSTGPVREVVQQAVSTLGGGRRA